MSKSESIIEGGAGDDTDDADDVDFSLLSQDEDGDTDDTRRTPDVDKQEFVIGIALRDLLLCDNDVKLPSTIKMSSSRSLLLLMLEPLLHEIVAGKSGRRHSNNVLLFCNKESLLL